jgi:hypothetical protein
VKLGDETFTLIDFKHDTTRVGFDCSGATFVKNEITDGILCVSVEVELCLRGSPLLEECNFNNGSQLLSYGQEKDTNKLSDLSNTSERSMLIESKVRVT